MMCTPLPRQFALGCLVLIACWLTPAQADTLHLRDGKTLVGIIDEGSSNDQHVVIRTTVGTQRVPRARVERIERQEAFSQTETSADIAAADGNLDRAQALYREALTAEPDNARIKQKQQDLDARIAQRDGEAFGAAFAQIGDLIKRQEFDTALEEANALITRVRQPATRERAERLVAEAHVGRARLNRDRIAYPDAEKDYLAAMQAAPGLPVSYLELADMLQLSPARKVEAIPYYVKGIDLATKLPPDQQTDDLLDYRYKLGKLYMDQRQFDEGAGTFLEVMRLDKEFRFPQAVDSAVEAYSRIQADGKTMAPEKIDSVVQNLELILQLKPNEQRAHLLLGKIMFDRKDWAAARDRFKRVVEISGTQITPASTEALYQLGVAERKLGNLDGAEAALQQLINARAASYDAVTELAEVRMEKGEYTEAMDLFNQALLLDQDKYRAWLGLGETLQKLQRYEEARAKLEEVVKRDPTNVQAQLSIAQSYYEQEKWDESVTEAEAAIKLLDQQTTDTDTDTDTDTEMDPQLAAKAYTLMGRNNLNLNKPNLARENFEAAIAKVPEFAPALDGIGKTHQANGMHEDAARYFEQAIAADPKNPEYHLSLGISWHQFRKSPEQALPHYLEYIRLGGKDPNVRQWIQECGGTVPETAKAG